MATAAHSTATRATGRFGMPKVSTRRTPLPEEPARTPGQNGDSEDCRTGQQRATNVRMSPAGDEVEVDVDLQESSVEVSNIRSSAGDKGAQAASQGDGDESSTDSNPPRRSRGRSSDGELGDSDSDSGNSNPYGTASCEAEMQARWVAVMSWSRRLVRLRVGDVLHLNTE